MLSARAPCTALQQTAISSIFRIIIKIIESLYSTDVPRLFTTSTPDAPVRHSLKAPHQLYATMIDAIDIVFVFYKETNTPAIAYLGLPKIDLVGQLPASHAQLRASTHARKIASTKPADASRSCASRCGCHCHQLWCRMQRRRVCRGQTARGALIAGAVATLNGYTDSLSQASKDARWPSGDPLYEHSYL
jgi:hypothetical protein